MSTLSVLYVVRNEEALLPGSIQSVSDIADEIVVVDTGSSDGTRTLAQRTRKCRVATYNWCHDFSKVRNFGIKQCSKDWILYLDADERLDKQSAAAIKSAIDSAPGHIQAFGLHMVDYENGWDHAPNMDPFFPSPQVRLFYRAPSIQFEGKVMESIVPSLERAKGGMDVLDARIQHWLWRGKGREFAQLKLNYYNKLRDGREMILSESHGGATPLIIEQSPRPRVPIAVVVAAFNAINATKQCVGSITRNTTMPVELILVDNGSHDGTASYMREVLGREPLTLRRNEGVAKARNLGAAEAMKFPDTKYICFLDNDTLVAPGWIETMSHLMDEDPSLGAIGPITNNAEGMQNASSQYPGMDTESIIGALPNREPPLVKVDWLSGFCLMARVDALKRTGLFDETFGLYGYEDQDLCLRLKAAGYELAIANRAYVAHRRGATLRANLGIDWHATTLTSRARFRAKHNRQEVIQSRSAPAPISPAPANLIVIGAKAQSAPKTSIVIITHNRLDMTRPCIESILRHTSNFELVLVDNGSTDGTVEYLKSKPARLIQNPKNLGVPIARNQGIRAANCSLVVLMDNDIEVREGWLEALAAAEADIAGIEAWQIDPKTFGTSRRCVNPNERFDYLGGACCLFRRRVFEEVGLLDEGFSPAYEEDVDLCIRAKAAGMTLKWVDTPKIIHKQHATLIGGGQKDFAWQEVMSRSYERFARKMRGELKVEHEKLPVNSRKISILYLGMEWDYGQRERGHSFEHRNFLPSLLQWGRAAQVVHFDYVALGQQHGVPKMSEMLCEAVQKHCPDALFSVFFDEHHDPRKEALRRISRTTPCKTINWFCDSHYRYENFDKPWSGFLDYCITTSTVAYQKYVRDGLASKAIKSQWAASPSYRRMPEVPLDMDVSFIGQPHGDRRQVIDDLRRAGINVRVFGHGWPTRLTFEEMIRTFSRSRVNLNLNNAADRSFKQIKGRNFEIPGCGGFLLTEMAENLGEYYVPDAEIGVYNSPGTLIEKIRYHLSHEEERAKIARAGYERTMREHTYAKRFDQVFARAGLL